MAPVAKKSRGKSDSSLWTKEKTMQLITLFEASSDLWNVSSPLYSNRNHKKMLQIEIGEKMEIDATEVAAKLHNLRCQYNGELRKCKLKKRDSGTDGVYVPRWEFFNALKFISNGGQSSSTTPNFEVIEETSSEYVNESGSESILADPLPSPPQSLVASISPYESYLYSNKGESKVNLQKDALMSNAIKILGTSRDSHQIFGDYIADQLRNMTEAKQKRLKLMIQKAIVVVAEET